MNEPYAADLAKPTFGDVARVCRALPHGEVVTDLPRLYGPHAGGWEAVGDAESGRGLLATLETVAYEDTEWFGGRCGE